MRRQDSQPGASGFPADTDQCSLFSVLTEHERAVVAALEEFATLRKESTDASRQGQTSSLLGEPRWYRVKCERLSRSLWRGLVTEQEARLELTHGHRVMLVTTTFKRPRRGTGTPRRRRVRFRWPRHVCPTCGARVGPFTGACFPCLQASLARAGFRVVGRDDKAEEAS